MRSRRYVMICFDIAFADRFKHPAEETGVLFEHNSCTCEQRWSYNRASSYQSFLYTCWNSIFLWEMAFYLQNLGGLASTSPWGKSSSASQNNTSHGCGSRKFSSWQALQMVDMSMYPLKAGEFPIGKEWQGLIPSALEWCNLWLKGTSLESDDFQEETDFWLQPLYSFQGCTKVSSSLHFIEFIPPKKHLGVCAFKENISKSLASGGYVAGTFAVLSPTSVAYLDFTGSGSETIAHSMQTLRQFRQWHSSRSV